LNLRPPAPKAGALAGLRHAPSQAQDKLACPADQHNLSPTGIGCQGRPGRRRAADPGLVDSRAECYHDRMTASRGWVAALCGAVLLLATCGGDQDRSEGRTEMLCRTGEGGQAARECTDQESASLEAALGVVRDYWALSYDREYELFSGSLRKDLKEVLGVSNPADYAQAMASNKRMWLKQVYKRAELLDLAHARVSVLVDWQQEGYQGVQTVIFDLEREGEAWKISVVFY
jgi:hypothetical protein